MTGSKASLCGCGEETRASEVGGGCGNVLGIVYRLLTGTDKSTEGKRRLMWKVDRGRQETESKLYRQSGKLIR